MSVLLADDSLLVRQGVRRLLEDGGEVEVVAEAASGPQLLACARAVRPDAVLTDIRMPPGFATEGIEAALTIRRELPSTGVVVLSQHADAAYARQLFRDGTVGLAYLLKERVADREEIVRAILAVAEGGSVVDPRIVEALVRAGHRQEASPLARLSPRELDVLREMAAGATNPAIAASLFVSESAVSKHISSIFAKLHLPDDQSVDRRVRAVLAYVTARPDPPDPHA